MILQSVLPRSVRIALQNARSEVLVNRSVLDVLSTDKSNWHRSGGAQSSSIIDYYSTIPQLDTSRRWLQLSANHHGRNTSVDSPQTSIIQYQCPEVAKGLAEKTASKEKDESSGARSESSASSANGTHDRSAKESSNGKTDIHDTDVYNVLRCYEKTEGN